jgi:signal transduction histidine kinase
MSLPLLKLELRLEVDTVLARQRARQIAALLGFDQLDQTRIATATSEIARNALQYAGGGRVEFLVESGRRPAYLIKIWERGPGIKDLQTILDGRYVSTTGLGIGILGAKRLMDRFEIETTPSAGVIVSMAKNLPNRMMALAPQELARISAELARHAPKGLIEELQQQNQELLEALRELRESQAELAQLHSRELDATNRGVVALYAELDEGTKTLQRLSDLKSRFLSEMSHELRSPLNSIKSLTGFLLSRSDGELTAEQEKQVTFIRQAADGLSTLVDDLLDLAKVAAGKAVIRAGWFSVPELLDSLHGMSRPMVIHQQVSLIFEAPSGITSMYTDAGKVEQILRNFITNAVKFTERGQIVVRTERGPGDHVVFSVTDSGIGIAAEDLDRIFEEFGQLENPLQRRVKGTGLGLPLARKLAQLLGGDVYVESEPGVGSTFFASLPRVIPGDPDAPSPRGNTRGADPVHEPPVANDWNTVAPKVLIVDDRERDRYLMTQALAAIGQFVIVEAGRGEEALELALSERPDIIFLDLSLPDLAGVEILERLGASEETRRIPVVIHTAEALDVDKRPRLERVSVAILSKGTVSRNEMIMQVRGSLIKAGLYSAGLEKAEPRDDT